MANEKIEIIIDEDGNATIEAFGFKDGACRAATEKIEKALGTVTKRKIKGDDCDIKSTVKVGK